MAFDKYAIFILFIEVKQKKNDLIFLLRSMYTIILGGTHQLDDYNRKVDAGDRQFIYEGCIRMNASIKRAEIVKEMVGLRPGQSQVRLERDTFTTSES